MNASRFIQLLKQAPSQTNSITYAILRERKKEKEEEIKRVEKKKGDNLLSLDLTGNRGIKSL